MQHVHTGGYAWLAPRQRLVITQCTAPHIDERVALGLHSIIAELAAAGVGHRLPGITVLHDWRSAQSFDASAVRAWFEQARRCARSYLASKTYIAMDGSPMLRAALRPAILASHNLMGIPLAQIVDDPEPILWRHGLHQPPAADALHEWLCAPVTGSPGVVRT